jgi:hypothetical protein
LGDRETIVVFGIFTQLPARVADADRRPHCAAIGRRVLSIRSL